MRAGLVIGSWLAMAAPLGANTLADMRLDLATLLLETQSLQRELINTGAAGFAHEGSLIDRTQQIEAALQSVTSQAESLEIRIKAMTNAMGRRVQELELRLCALEPSCVPGALGATLPLELASEALQEAGPVPAGPTLTLTEQDEYDSSLSALTEGDTETAIVLFLDFLSTFPKGPLTQSAQYYLGQAYMETGAFKLAARSFLESYSIDENTDVAPEALLNLGLAFHKMGKESEGCLTLNEVRFRFEGLSAAQDAQELAADLSCA